MQTIVSSRRFAVSHCSDSRAQPSLSLRFQMTPASARNTFGGILFPDLRTGGVSGQRSKSAGGLFVVLKNTGGVEENQVPKILEVERGVYEEESEAPTPG